MSLVHALLLGLIEGLTEFLPISSTAHLMIAARLLQLPQTEFLKTFEIAIQLGAILAVVVLYWRSFLLERAVLLRVCIAFLPTAVIGFLLHSIVKTIFLESIPLVLWTLFLGGIVLVMFDGFFHRTEKSGGMADMSLLQAFLIGMAQSVAIVPGVSRAAATIVGGELAGLSRRTIVDFSFVLAVPTMAAATALDLWTSKDLFSAADAGFLITGFLTSFVVALLAIKWFLRFIKGHSFVPFGIYRIALAVTLWFTLFR